MTEPIPTTWHASSFDAVRIEWLALDPRGEAYRVRVRWLSGLIVDAAVNGRCASLPFSASTENGKRWVAGQVDLRGRGELVLVFLRQNSGEVTNVVLWPTVPPPRPDVIQPAPEEVAERIEAGGASDLFPYIYLRPWPRVGDAEMENRFVCYLGTCEGGPTSLYCTLVGQKAQNDRAAMEHTAVQFIEGAAGYAGEFLGTNGGLEGAIRQFGGFDAHVRAQPGSTLADFLAELERALGMSWDALAIYIRSAPYQTQLERAWQNLFALMIVLGYDPGLRDDLVRTVVLARLLDRIAATPGDPIVAWPPQRIHAGVVATVVLPATVFPLPPATALPVPRMPGRPRLANRGGDTPDRIEPYAIGDLQLVRQRLLRYELGEVSAIENVLKGESKQTTRRSLRRRAESVREAEAQDSEAASGLRGTRADLLRETRRTLQLDFKLESQTHYGPPAEGTADGYLKLRPASEGPQAFTEGDATRLARSVTARTADRITRRITHQREVTALDEDASEVVARFDATASAENVRGVYRWVNQVYEAYVVNYGQRLILEFFVKDPARAYVSGEESLAGVTLAKPVAPEQLGVLTFHDVSTDAASPGYYPRLAARYGVRNILPPPAPTLLVGASFQGGVEVHAQEIRLPDGYSGQKAALTVNQSAGSVVYGVLGGEAFSFPESGTRSVSLSGETASVPLAIALKPGEPSKPAPGVFLAMVEVEAALASERFERWQIATYDAVMEGYTRQRAEYYGSAGASPAGRALRNPLANRETVRQQLKKAVLRQLLRQAAELTGEAWELVAGGPRYVQFFEQALEWSEMAYTFTVRVGEEPGASTLARYAGEDEPFTAFLQAGYARVLLPVSPRHAFAVPYFLASGMLWDGPDELAPADTASVPVVNELKSAADRSVERGWHSEPWQVRIPTAMVMLQESAELPVFESRERRR